jgi:hypothetical protein
MNKEKILGLSNTDDVMWYKLSPGDETLKQIDLIFDIYDNLYEDDAKNIHSYAFHIESGEMYFHKETENFVVYFIFTKNTAHVILRKTLNWKNYDSEIHKNFEFIK